VRRAPCGSEATAGHEGPRPRPDTPARSGPCPRSGCRCVSAADRCRRSSSPRRRRGRAPLPRPPGPRRASAAPPRRATRSGPTDPPSPHSARRRAGRRHSRPSERRGGGHCGRGRERCEADTAPLARCEGAAGSRGRRQIEHCAITAEAEAHGSPPVHEGDGAARQAPVKRARDRSTARPTVLAAGHGSTDVSHRKRNVSAVGGSASSGDSSRCGAGSPSDRSLTGFNGPATSSVRRADPWTEIHHQRMHEN